MNIDLNTPIATNKATYTLINYRKHGFQLFAILIQGKNVNQLRTFNDLAIAKTAMFNLVRGDKWNYL